MLKYYRDCKKCGIRPYRGLHPLFYPYLTGENDPPSPVCPVQTIHFKKGSYAVIAFNKMGMVKARIRTMTME